MDLAILFFLFLLALGFSFISYYKNVTFLGIFAGIIMILMGLNVAEGTITLNDCYALPNQTITNATTNTTTYTNEVICSSYDYDVGTNNKLAVGWLSVLAGLGIAMDALLVAGYVKKEA